MPSPLHGGSCSLTTKRPGFFFVSIFLGKDVAEEAGRSSSHVLNTLRESIGTQQRESGWVRAISPETFLSLLLAGHFCFAAAVCHLQQVVLAWSVSDTSASPCALRARRGCFGGAAGPGHLTHFRGRPVCICCDRVLRSTVEKR